jgi:hypothetical protein
MTMTTMEWKGAQEQSSETVDDMVWHVQSWINDRMGRDVTVRYVQESVACYDGVMDDIRACDGE